MTGTLLVRADGGAAIGAGHVMRSLALAQGWQDAGGAVEFAAARLSDALRRRLADEGVAVADLQAPAGGDLDAEATVERARRADAAWVVADGYDFGAAFQRRIRDAGLRLLLLDDFGHAGQYHADIVLNVNPDADPTLYAGRDPGTRLLLGTSYALLRREFRQRRDFERLIPPVARRVLVTFGGADPHDLSAATIRAIHTIDEPELETTVVAAGEDLRRGLAPLAAAGRQPVTVLGHVADMAELMVAADLAVAAAGGTSWERALLRLPSLVVPVADNQRANARALHRAGAAIDLGWWPEVDEACLASAIRRAALDAPLRRRQAEAAGRLVDGLGVDRVLEAMAS